MRFVQFSAAAVAGFLVVVLLSASFFSWDVLISGWGALLFVGYALTWLAGMVVVDWWNHGRPAARVAAAEKDQKRRLERERHESELPAIREQLRQSNAVTWVARCTACGWEYRDADPVRGSDPEDGLAHRDRAVERGQVHSTPASALEAQIGRRHRVDVTAIPGVDPTVAMNMAIDHALFLRQMGD